MANDGGDNNSTTSSPQSREQTSNPSEALIKSLINPQGQLISIHLEEGNFLLWKFQIETAIRGYGLEDYILGTNDTPAKYTADNEGKLIKNPEYTTYTRQDSLLSAWLLSSISANILPQLVGCKTSQEIWATITQIFNTQSAARVMYYKRQLQNSRKENQPMREYLSKIKTICDMLETAGHKVSETEQILTILNGLGEEYESVVAVISSKENLPSMQHVQSILLSHEGRIESKKPMDNDYSINVTDSRYRGQERNNNLRNNTAQNSQRGRGYGRSRGRGRWFNNNRPKCQICERLGHTAARCFFRFDTNFTLPQQPSNASQKQYNPSANIANLQSEIRGQPDNQKNEITKIEDINDDSWYPDSGATNHVTNNLNNLNLGNREYKG